VPMYSTIKLSIERLQNYTSGVIHYTVWGYSPGKASADVLL
jgi:hypothetical protein